MPSRVVRGVAWSYAAYAAEGVVGLALVAFVVRRVGVADFGVLTLALSVASLTQILDLGLLGLLVQATVASRARGGTEAASRLVSAAFLWLIVAGAAAFLVCAAIAAIFPGPFEVEPELVETGRTSLLLAGAAAMVQLPATALQLAHVSSGAFGRISRIQVAVALVRAVFTLPLIAMGYGIVALASIHLGVACLRLVLFWTGLAKHAEGIRISSDSDWHGLRELLPRRRWATGDGIARQAAASSNSIVLGILASSSAVATFGIASRVPGHLFALANRGISVTLPYLSAHHHRDDEKELRSLFASTTAVAILILVPVCILGLALAPAIIRVIGGAQYMSAVPVFRVLLFATMVQAFSEPAYQVLYARGRIAVAARIGISEALANIALTILLVPRFGALGAATATAVTHTVGTFGWFMPAAMKAANMSGHDLIVSLGRHARELREIRGWTA